VAAGVTVSDAGMVATRGEQGADEWRGALAEGPVDTGGRTYAEWVIEEADGDCSIMLGVTALEETPPAGTTIHSSRNSRMFDCLESTAWPGNCV
jgi:hypothetical protein